MICNCVLFACNFYGLFYVKTESDPPGKRDNGANDKKHGGKTETVERND